MSKEDGYLNLSGMLIDVCLYGDTHVSLINRELPYQTENSYFYRIAHLRPNLIHVLFKFSSNDERTEWENRLSPLLKSWLDRTIIEEAIDYAKDFNQDAYINLTKEPK